MYVNPFALGFFCGMVVMFLLISVWASIHNRHDVDDEPGMTQEEYKRILEETTGKKFRIREYDGYLVGEPIEDDDDDETDAEDQ